jgi:hypothetical protein
MPAVPAPEKPFFGDEPASTVLSNRRLPVKNCRLRVFMKEVPSGRFTHAHSAAAYVMLYWGTVPKP